SGQPRKDPPPCCPEGDHDTRPEPIGQAARGCLRERISEHERAEHRAELRVIQMQIALKELASDGDVYAIEISHHADHEHPADQQPADHLCTLPDPSPARSASTSLVETRRKSPGIECFRQLAAVANSSASRSPASFCIP